LIISCVWVLSVGEELLGFVDFLVCNGLAPLQVEKNSSGERLFETNCSAFQNSWELLGLRNVTENHEQAPHLWYRSLITGNVDPFKKSEETTFSRIPADNTTSYIFIVYCLLRFWSSNILGMDILRHSKHFPDVLSELWEHYTLTKLVLELWKLFWENDLKENFFFFTD